MVWNSHKFRVVMRWMISRSRRDVCRRILLCGEKLQSIWDVIKKKRVKPGPMAFLLYGLLATAVVIILFGIYLGLLWRPLPEGNDRDVVIPYASSARGVANQLEAEGIIRSASGFLWYLRLFGRHADLKAGAYQLKPGMGLSELFTQLRKGSPLVYRITIPEGYNLKEVASLLAEKRLVDYERFLQLAQEPQVLSRYIKGFGTLRSAEGFLFPDTYELVHGADEEEILAVFFRRFQAVWNEEFPSRTVNRPLYEIITMASIVEREAKVAKERPVIAGVFYNRLQRKIPLESCATVQYALGRHKARLYYRDLQIESEYNTYRHRGLPPGPICSPGREAIRAALAPTNHSYLYFVAKPNGNHHFSTSYREHLNARRRIQQKS